MKVSLYCPECFERIELPPPGESGSGEVRCRNGHPPLAYTHAEGVHEGRAVEKCSHCGKTAFFSQRDFDQRLGCLVIGIGIFSALLASWRMGGIYFVPVLLLVVAVDLVVARSVGHVVICYRCDAEYRGVPGAARVKPYDPHVAERDAEVKTVRRMNP